MAAQPPVLPETAHFQDSHITNDEVRSPTEERIQEATSQRDDGLEATQLRHYGSRAGYRVVSVRDVQRDSKLNRFWRRQVCATVEHEGCRDHFALERTFLGYLRTSLVLANIGVIVAQLFRLEHSLQPNTKLGYFVIGVPLASVCVIAAMLVTLLGGYRFWKQQNAILRGKAYAGGWDVNAVAGTVLIVTLAIFVVLVAIDVEKEFKSQ